MIKRTGAALSFIRAKAVTDPGTTSEQLLHQLCARKAEPPRAEHFVELIQFKLFVRLGRNEEDRVIFVFHEQILRMPAGYCRFQLSAFSHRKMRRRGDT